jgi:hypothetical protein
MSPVLLSPHSGMLLSLIIMLIVEPVHLGEDDKPYMMPVHEPTEDTAANGRKLARDGIL